MTTIDYHDSGILTITVGEDLDVHIYERVNAHIYSDELKGVFVVIPDVEVFLTAPIWSVYNIPTMFANEVAYFFHFLRRPLPITIVTDDIGIYSFFESYMRILPVPVYNTIRVRKTVNFSPPYNICS